MRRLLPALVLAFAATPVAGEETHPFSVQDLVALERISDPRVSPDGGRVAFTVRTTDLEANRGRTDVWLAAVDGGWSKRLTSHPDNDSGARWSPDGRTLFFLSARSGSSQVWKIAADGGEAQPVTSLPLDVETLAVSPDGSFLVFSMRVFPGTSPEETAKRQEESKKKKASGMLYEQLLIRHWDEWEDGTRNHLFAYRLESGRLTDLMPAMNADCPSRPFGGTEEFQVAPDGKSIAFSAKDVGREEAWSTNFDLFTAPADGSAAPRKITSNPAWDTQPAFSPDGKTLAYLAMARAGYEADRFDLVLRDLASGAERKITVRADDSPRGDRSPSGLAWSPDSTTIYTAADHLGQHAVFAVEVKAGKSRLVVSQGTADAPQPAGRRVLYSLNSLLGPTELYTVNPDGTDPRRVTHLNDARLAAIRFGQPEQFSFAGAGGDPVYGYLVRPVDFDPARTYPVAFLIHGGPQGSFGNDFHYRWNPQTYAGAGYAAVMVDFHGSTGYGQAFTDAIQNDWGGKPYEDLMKGLDHALAKNAFLESGRVCALGASFGGYMINWIEGQTGRFKCLVAHDGNLDERMSYYDTEELWFPEWDHAGVPWERPENYTKHNPAEFVANWARFRTPMLVIHGGKDFRVVSTQGISTFTALQRLGIPSKFLYFPDENHWVLKPQNSIQWHKTVLGWLDQWLKK